MDALDEADELYSRYIDWLCSVPESKRTALTPDGNLRTPEALLPDALAHDALDAMREAEREDPRLSKLLTVFRAVDREFTKGWRCGVCADADDPTYDHTNNC